MTLYVDMDGVLTDFDRSLDNLMGHHVEDFGDDPKIWARIDAAGEDFWADMEWTSDGPQLWEEVKKYDPTILSSPSRDRSSIEGKKKWLAKHLPGVPYIIESKKQRYAAPDAILIDDRSSKIRSWEKSGGVGILHRSAVDSIRKLGEVLQESAKDAGLEQSSGASRRPSERREVWRPGLRVYETHPRGERTQRARKGPGSYRRREQRDVGRYMEASRRLRWLSADVMRIAAGGGRDVPELILTVGIPGSGKSRWIRSHGSGHVVISPDDIRRELSGDVSDQSVTPQAWALARQRMERALGDGRDVILDATNVSRMDRERTLSGLPPHRLKAKIFDVDPEVAKQRIRRDLERGVDRSAVPEHVIDRMYERFRRTIDEGQLKQEGFEII